MEFSVDQPEINDRISICANDHGLNELAADNTTTLNKALQACKKMAPCKLEIIKGKYRFDNTETINIKDLDDFILCGNDSEFIFSDTGHFRLNNCNKVLLKDIKIDWDWEKDRLASLAIVRTTLKEKEYIEFEFPELECIDTSIRFFNMYSYDPVTLSPGTENGREFYENNLRVEKIAKGSKDNSIRIIPVKGSFENISSGDCYLIRHSPRRGSALIATDCTHLTLKNITVFSSPGNCFVVNGKTHHVRLDSCMIGLKPGTNRHMSTHADGYHVAQSQGYHIIENCDFSYMGDDDVNIHDSIGLIYEIVGEKTIGLVNQICGEPGDIFEIRKPDFSQTGSFLKLVEYKMTDRKPFLVFDKEIPKNVKETYLIRNTKYNSSNYIIRNNHFHHNRARGLLLQADEGLVENNRFTRIQGAAIYVMMEVLRGLWYEGTGVRNLVIRNNIFNDCNVNDWTSVIDIMAIIPDNGSKYKIFKDILIENNHFNEFPSGVFYINRSENIIIRNNSFKSEQARMINKGNRGHIYIVNSTDVRIENNLWEPSTYMMTPGTIHDNQIFDGGSYRDMCLGRYL